MRIKSYVQIGPPCLHDNLGIDNVVPAVHIAPKEPQAAPKKNKESFTGSRKNKLKSRLIVRNLSFQV